MAEGSAEVLTENEGGTSGLLDVAPATVMYTESLKPLAVPVTVARPGLTGTTVPPVPVGVTVATKVLLELQVAVTLAVVPLL